MGLGFSYHGKYKDYINEYFNINIKPINNCNFDEYVTRLKSNNVDEKAVATILNSFQYERILLNDYYRVNLHSDITRDNIQKIGLDWPVVDKEYINKCLAVIREAD